MLATGGLPTLPEIAARVMSLVRDPSSSLQDLARVIGNDPALSGRILKVANSAFYGLSQQVGSLKMALVLLGMKNVTNIVTSISIFQAMQGGEKDGLFSRREFWAHSAACGRVCGLLEQELKVDLAGEGFVCGLVHDIGKIVMDVAFPDGFENIIQRASLDRVAMADVEVEVLGVNHGQIGQWLIERWKLPDRIASAIERHHLAPVPLEEDPLCAILQLANALIKREGFGFSGYESPPSLENLETWPVLQGRTMDWESLSKRIRLEFEAVEEFIRFIK